MHNKKYLFINNDKTMKKSYKIILATVFLISTISINNFVSAQPNPSGNGNGSNTGNTIVGGGAPIGGGLLFLFAMGAFYGIKKRGGK